MFKPPGPRMPSAPPPFLALPTDVAHCIAVFLPDDDIATLTRTCRDAAQFFMPIYHARNQFGDRSGSITLRGARFSAFHTWPRSPLYSKRHSLFVHFSNDIETYRSQFSLFLRGLSALPAASFQDAFISSMQGSHGKNSVNC